MTRVVGTPFIPNDKLETTMNVPKRLV